MAGGKRLGRYERIGEGEQDGRGRGSLIEPQIEETTIRTTITATNARKAVATMQRECRSESDTSQCQARRN